MFLPQNNWTYWNNMEYRVIGAKEIEIHLCELLRDKINRPTIPKLSNGFTAVTKPIAVK